MSVAASREVPRSTHLMLASHAACDWPSEIAAKPHGGVLKLIFDRVLAFVLLIPGLPLIAMLSALVRLTSRGPGIYSQLRVGQGGRVFTMYKLRSMHLDAEAVTGPVWSGGCDPRVTFVGRWLRRLHLDELPQLFNVLRGDMSLVGPRPERPEFVRVLAAEIPGYLDRLSVLPGVTGLAQINLPPDTDLDSVRRKLALDREYIVERSLLFDIRIILCTLLRISGLRGGRGAWLLGLRRTVSLPHGAAPIGGSDCAIAATPEAVASHELVASPVAMDVRAHVCSDGCGCGQGIGFRDDASEGAAAFGET